LFTITEILEIAIKIEKNGKIAYRSAIEKIPDASLIRLLEWMADEEASHMEWLLDLKQKVETNSENPFDQNMPRHMLTEIIGDQRFSLKEIDFSRIDNIGDLIDILIEFEQDTILFYEMLQPFIQSEETLSQLNQIIAEEKRHIEKLQELMKHTTAAIFQKS
jgi:rubrerythrin